MKLFLIFILFYVALVACRGRSKATIVYKDKKETTNSFVTPEVSSTIEVITSSSGKITVTREVGATKHKGRLLAGDCSTELVDLGTQESPDFSIPIDMFYQSVCLETTYLDAAENVLKIKIQPVKIEGPEAISIELPLDSQFIDFQDVEGASQYHYIVFDEEGNVKLSGGPLAASQVDFNEALTTGNYKMIIIARSSDDENIRAIAYEITVVPADSLIEQSLSSNIRFEKQFYQTRSFKRLLVPEDALTGSESLEIDGMLLNTLIINAYSGGFAALIDADDGLMSGIIPYGSQSVSIILRDIMSQPVTVPVVLQDFTLFEVSPAGFGDGSYVKSGFEAWLSIYSRPAISSGGHHMATDFGLMILQ